MNKEEFISEMETILEITPGTLALETTLNDLDEWNSLAILGVIALADESAELALSPKNIRACASIGDLYLLFQTPGV